MLYTYHPKVTIVIPVYNGELYMKFAIDSALNQTYDNLEVMVINDGSKDATEKIAKEYEGKIRYIKKDNGGVSSVLNIAIREMTGEWLSWLSHDDVYYPEKIEQQIRFIDSQAKRLNINHESIVACCANDRIDTEGKRIIRPIKYGRNKEDGIDLLIDQIANYSIGGCCVLAHRDVYRALGGFNENNRTCSDAEMWYKMMLNGYTFLFEDEVLVHSRQHKEMVSVTKKELCISEGTILHKQIAEEILKIRHDNDTKKKLALALGKRGYSTVSNDLINQLTVGDKIIVKTSLLFSLIRQTCRGGLRAIYRKLFY